MNIWHCPVCGLEEEKVSDFRGDRTFICSNGHAIVYHFGEWGESSTSNFDCPICGKTHLSYDKFDDYPAHHMNSLYFLMWNSMYKIFNW